MKDDHSETREKLISAYHRMLEQTQSAFKETLQDTAPQLKKLIDNAVETSIEIGELTKEEAHKIGEYLRRDLQDATEYMHTSNKELKDWFRFDLELVEDRLLEMFSLMSDPTRIALDNLAQTADMAEWHTGEITGPGTLRCDDCDHDLHFHQVGHIPPCPNCHATKFHRIRE